jgi:hypothetical protein
MATTAPLRTGLHLYTVRDDMQQDPEELNNLAVKPEHRKTLMRLRALAIAELRRSKAGFVDRMPAVREFALKQ